MYDIKRVKEMIRAGEIAVTEQTERRIMNDEMTERDHEMLASSFGVIRDIKNKKIDLDALFQPNRIEKIKDTVRMIKETAMSVTDLDDQEYIDDMNYLFSKLEIAENSMLEFVEKHYHGGSKANRDDYTIFNVTTADVYKLREALQQIRS